MPVLSGVRPLWRVDVPDGLQNQIQVERVVAAARASMATVALSATWIDPTEPRKFVAAVYSLLVGYTLYAIVVWLLVARVQPERTHRIGLALLVADLVWVSVISFLTEGPNSLFFVFFVFVLLSTAYRWGLRETLIVGAVSVVVLDTQALWVLYGPANAAADVEVNRLIIRNAYLLLVASLVGALAEKEKQARGRAMTLAGLLAQVHVDSGLRQSLHAVLNRLVALFGGRSAVAVFEQADTGRLFIAHVRPRLKLGGTTLTIRRLPHEEREHYLFDVPQEAECWETDADAGRGEEVTAIDAKGVEVHPGGAWPVPRWIVAEKTNVMVVTFRFGHEWKGRLFLLDVERNRTRVDRLRFLLDTVRHVGPSLYGLYLLRFLQSRADMMARADVAEELHQGIIQSLVGLEMQVDVLRRSGRGIPPEVVTQLGAVREALAVEIRGVRALMAHLRQPVVGPGQLPQFLEDLVDRFGRETGIAATFRCSDGRVRLSPRRCREVVTFVREALTNVRKHSGARSVVVQLATNRLTVTDDGRGLGSEAPKAITERARLSGASLRFGSEADAGTHIELVFPEEAPWIPRPV